MPRRAILTPAQGAVLRLLGEQTDLRDQYVLSGGTALAAFHLHHRRSDDLDFFSLERVDDLRVRRFVEECRELIGTGAIEANRLYDRHLFLLPLPDTSTLKLEFTQYPYPALAAPSEHDGVRVESLRDIAADKLAAMLDRFEPKDYYDMYVLLHDGHATLEQIRRDLEQKFSLRADPISLGAAFMRAEKLPVLPHVLKSFDSKIIGQFFSALAQSLKVDVLGNA